MALRSEKKTSQRDIFEASGPTYLTTVNWDCVHYRRSVAACLVQGAYVLERDRQKNHHGPQAYAPPWWEFFHFQLVNTLIDDADSSIFGAIYEYKNPTFIWNSTANAPKYVVAFRGTIAKKKSFSQDIKLDLHIIKHCLHQTPRFENAMQAVQNLVADAGHSNVWIAGHSLGASMATLAGKNMAKFGVNLVTYLFSPPFISVPIERVKDEKVKQAIRVAGSFITAGLTVAVKGRNSNSEAFSMLSSWIPNIFVNPSDNICSAYVGYFEHRKKMAEIGAVKVGKLATENSVRDLLLNAFGRDSEPLHLLPSANMTVNLSPSVDFKTAHGLHQWWRTDQNLQFKEYHYD